MVCNGASNSKSSSRQQISSKRSQNLHLCTPQSRVQTEPFQSSPRSHHLHSHHLPSCGWSSSKCPTHHRCPSFQVNTPMTAMDLTQHGIGLKLTQLKPDIVFFAFSYWIPEITCRLGIVSIHYCTNRPSALAYFFFSGPSRWEEEFPSSAITLKKCEDSSLHSLAQMEFGIGTKFKERYKGVLSNCDAVAFKSCREMEGVYGDYLGKQLGKPILFTGPGLPTPPTESLETRWVNWLNKFEKQSVVYVAFGSDSELERDQFEELLLGLELMGLPFLAALKPPNGVETIDEAPPQGFQERVGERGIVYGGWMQQQLILTHPSVGCFVTHCGSGSLSEALVSECQIVMLPNAADQFTSTKLMAGELKVGVEVEKRDVDGWYTKENVCEAVKLVMDEESEVGSEVGANHAKWREFLLREGLESSYIDGFITDVGWSVHVSKKANRYMS